QNETTIRNRIKVYHNETAPVFNYYGEKGKSFKVEGMGSIEDIAQRIAATINNV
ncbi:MAG: adenylate kinase, partial [Saprospiraceae bacterium]|nr:adenylate kinase [Saprospiraceae bacterium]